MNVAIPAPSLNTPAIEPMKELAVTFPEKNPSLAFTSPVTFTSPPTVTLPLNVPFVPVNEPPTKLVAFNVVNVPVVPVIGAANVTLLLNVDNPAQLWSPVQAKSKS